METGSRAGRKDGQMGDSEQMLTLKTAKIVIMPVACNMCTARTRHDDTEVMRLQGRLELPEETEIGTGG